MALSAGDKDQHGLGIKTVYRDPSNYLRSAAGARSKQLQINQSPASYRLMYTIISTILYMYAYIRTKYKCIISL